MFYDPDGSLVLPAVPELIESETEDAARKRRKRKEKKMLELEMSKDVTLPDTMSGKCPDINTRKHGNVTNVRTMSGKYEPQCPENVAKTATNGLTLDKRPDNVPENVTLEIRDKDKSLISSLSSLEEKEKEVTKEIVNLYRTNCSPMMAEIELERILDCIGHYGPVWTKEAIETAVWKGKRNIAYIEGILKNWEVEGHGKGNSSKRKKPIQRKARKVTDGTETDWDAEAGKGWDD